MENLQLTSLLALSFGFVHALEPGHGKTALFTYLASGKKSWKEGIVISLSSALSHSLAVFLIALISHFAIHHSFESFNPQTIEVALKLISSILILSLGLWIIFKEFKGGKEKCCSGHHSHAPVKEKTGIKKYLSALIVGIATGMAPCPTVLAAYLSGLSSGNSLSGVKSVVLFAVGMSAALMLVVIFFKIGGPKLFSKLKIEKKVLSWNYIQGGLLVIIGAFMGLYH